MGYPGGQIPALRHRSRVSAAAVVKAAAGAVAATVAVAGVLASEIKEKEGSPHRWRPEGEYVSRVLFDIISFRSLQSGRGNDGQRFAHLQSITIPTLGEIGSKIMAASGKDSPTSPTRARRRFRSHSCSLASQLFDK